MMKLFQNEKDLEEAIGDARGRMLLAFVATWCRPCRLMMPTVEKTEKETEDLRVFLIDTDAMEDFCDPFSITGTPTYILFCDGRERGRIEGYHDEDTFRRKLRNLMKEETKSSSVSE